MSIKVIKNIGGSYQDNTCKPEAHEIPHPTSRIEKALDSAPSRFRGKLREKV
jgi:hypothetical protein